MEPNNSNLTSTDLSYGQDADRLRFAMNAAGIGVWEVNLATNTVIWDDRCRELFGLSKDNLLPYEQAIRYIHPDDVARVDGLVKAALKGENNGSYNATYRTIGGDDKKLRWVNFTGTAYFDAQHLLTRFGGVALDVTDNHNQQQKILDFQEKIITLLQHSSVAIAVNIRDGLTFTAANRFYGELVGRLPGELIGKPLLKALPELKGKGFDDLLNSVLNSGQPYFAEERGVELIRDGKPETVYVNFAYQPLGEENGTITSTLTVVTDVTSQVLARKKIEESEAKFRLMAENTPVLITVGDEKGDVTYFNKAWTDLTGKSMEDLMQGGWETLIHEDDRKPFANIFYEAFVVKAPFNGEFRVTDEQGIAHWLLAHGVPRFDKDGNFIGYIAAATEITEHKKLQQQLQSALEQIYLSKEAAELGTFDLDLENGTMHWDERCRNLFGISTKGPVTYEKDFVQGLHPDDRERILKVIDQLFIKPASNGNYDVEYRTVGVEDGIIRWVRAKGKVFFNQEDKPLRFIGSVLDITEKVTALQKIESLVEERTKDLAKANDDLHIINKELQRSNQNLEEFAYAASHDLKEPVRKIQVFTQQLKQQLSVHLQDAELRSFNRIENASKRMGNLIDDLLLYSHVSQRPRETEDVDLNQKVKNVLEDLELDIQEKKAEINVASLPVVRGHRRQLQQLFHNLLSNAVKYSKSDIAPRIDIIWNEVQENGIRYHLLKVKDNGIGFKQEYADKIFQIFTRLHANTEYGGTGVGLSIVKKVVENHNGFIKVESAPGEGSTFSVMLPVE